MLFNSPVAPDEEANVAVVVPKRKDNKGKGKDNGQGKKGAKKQEEPRVETLKDIQEGEELLMHYSDELEAELHAQRERDNAMQVELNQQWPDNVKKGKALCGRCKVWINIYYWKEHLRNRWHASTTCKLSTETEEKLVEDGAKLVKEQRAQQAEKKRRRASESNEYAEQNLGAAKKVKSARQAAQFWKNGAPNYVE